MKMASDVLADGLTPAPELKVAMGNEPEASPISPPRRFKQLTLLNTFVMAFVASIAVCMLIWLTGTLLSRSGKGAAEALPKWRLARFDVSHTLKRGDMVAIRREDMSGVWRVTGSLNNSVLLKQGNVTKGIYMVGDNSYIVTSGSDTRIIRATDILGVVEPATKPVLRDREDCMGSKLGCVRN